eukprot:EG_transcript_10821
MAQALFQRITVGKLALAHRVVMSPMTRTRNEIETEAPTALNATYYAQRASAGGLVIAEALSACPMARGYTRGGALYTPEQVAGWRKVTDAVHEKGGYIFAQLFHAGRITHSSLLPDGATPIAPSAIAAKGTLHTPTGKQEYETPRALETAEVAGVIAEIAAACRRAVDEAGFDGVELHAGNGYLLQQFLAESTNQRTDQYGGSVENRCRFVLELVDAAVEAVGSDRVAIKLQPGVTFSDIIETEEDTRAQLAHLGPELSRRSLAYVCLSSLNGIPYCFAIGLQGPNFKEDIFSFFRPLFSGTLMINGALTPETAEQYVKDNVADLAAFGNLFLANANLPALIRAGKELNLSATPKMWYGLPNNTPEQDAEHYTNWPLVEC